MSKKNIGLLVLICGVVAFAITTFGVWLASNYAFGQQDYYYEGGQAYSRGDCQLNPSQVKNIEIDWLSGNVTIERYQGDVIQITETDSPSPDADKLHYHLNDSGYLQIRYFSSRQTAGIYHKVENKDLVIRVPENCSFEDIQLTINAGNATLTDLTLEDKAYITVVSGNVNLNSCEVEKLFCDISQGLLNDVGSTIQQINAGVFQGNIKMSGAYGVFDGGVQQGNISLETWSATRIKAQIDQGNLNVILPENIGFTARYLVDTGSINFGDFQVNNTGSTEAICGDGALELILTVKSGVIDFKAKK